MEASSDFLELLRAQNSIVSNITINDYELIVMFWNIFLVLVAFFLYFLLYRVWRKSGFLTWSSRLSGAVLGFLWLLFFPNVPYLITEVRHLLDFCPADSSFHVCASNAWMIAFFFFYAVLAWPLYVYLVQRMSVLVRQVWGAMAGWFFLLAIAPVGALGVVLGLVERWNSWQVFVRPTRIWEDVVKYTSGGPELMNWLAFTLLLYLLYFLGVRLFAFARG